MELIAKAACRESELRPLFSRAWQLAGKTKPHSVSEDDLQVGALKWWRRLLRQPAPDYIVANGTIVPEHLAFWIVVSAVDARKRRWKKEANERALVVDPTPFELGRGDHPFDVADRLAFGTDEVAIERVAAKQATQQLDGDDVDPVLYLRADEWTYDEIGAALGVTTNNARIRALRARRRHMAELKESGW